MMEVIPDRWVLVEQVREDTKFTRVFSGNYGGYTGSDTWRLSSEVVSIEDDSRELRVITTSGTAYRLGKQARGMSSYMSQVFQTFQDSVVDIEVLE